MSAWVDAAMHTLFDPRRTGRRWQDEAAAVGRHVGLPTAAAIAVLTAVGSAAGFLVTGMGNATVARADLDLARALVDGRTATVDRVTGAATVLADSTTVALLWVVAMVYAARRTRSWEIPVFLLVAIGGEKLTYLLTSLVVGRPRPPVRPLGEVFATNSFPSGHVGSAIVLYGGLVVAARWHDRWTRRRLDSVAVRAGLGAVVTAVTVLVGFSRLYRGHHFLSDVIWGVALGVGWLAFGYWVVLRGRSLVVDSRVPSP